MSSEESELEVLAEDECRRLLSLAGLGRIAFVDDGHPVVFPINFRLLIQETGPWIVFRTRPGNLIDKAPEQVAFEIDGIDHENRKGWSVLVRGVLHHLDHIEIEFVRYRFDPKPWVEYERSSWLAIKPRVVTGRRLKSADQWALPPDAYL